MPKPEYIVTATVIDGNPDLIVTALEAFGRAATGLALDGAHVSLTVAELEELPEEE